MLPSEVQCQPSLRSSFSSSYFEQTTQTTVGIWQDTGLAFYVSHGNVPPLSMPDWLREILVVYFLTSGISALCILLLAFRDFFFIVKCNTCAENV